MFLENSRYVGVETVETDDGNGRKVSVVKLRRLAYAAGKPTVVKGNDRLDVVAQRSYSDGTKFWRVADGNTELEANRLVEQHENDKEVRVINVPEK